MARYRLLAYAGLALGLGLSSACRAEMSPMTETRSSRDQTAARGDAVEAAFGLWRIADAHGSAYCLVALNRQASGSDYGVHIDSCGMPELGMIRAWRPTEGGFELLRYGSSPGLSFRQTGVDSFETRDGALKASRAVVP